MSGLEKLMKFAERRAEHALSSWQRLTARCDEAKQKLGLLKEHGEGYRDLMRADLQQGVSATSTMAHLGFIRQIEAVIVRQESDIVNLEDTRGRLWQELVEARREQRMYEILSERAQMRHASKASRRQQAEMDELLQRAVRTP